MIKILLVFLIIYIAWLFLNFVILLVRNSRVVSSFNKLEKLLNKRYQILEGIALSVDTTKYLRELKELPKGVEFLNRKLALNYIVSENLKKEINIESLPDEYKIINAELATAGNVYNLRANSLKIATEIFPKSFYARFLNIKTVDFYRG